MKTTRSWHNLRKSHTSCKIKFLIFSENTIVTQMELEKKMADFNKDMNDLKNKSILKKSFDQRKNMYRQMMREAERKRKEEEEKEADKQG